MNILIADDNKKIANILKEHVIKEGYHAVIAHDGQQTLDIFNTQNIDLILLDVMMPKVDGFEVCKRIREHSMVPIIMVTAKSEDYDKIMGLDLGADDYIVKPFSPQEIMARIRALLRRYQGNNDHVTIHNLTIDNTNHHVIIDDETIALTKKEFDILYLLASNVDRVFSRDNILDKLWGWDYVGDTRTVDTHIKRLRTKIDAFKHPQWDIETVWGVGYKFVVKNHE